MTSKPISLESSFIPEEPVHTEAAPVSWGGVLERVAADLYRVGSMLLGEGEETISIVEHVVTRLDIGSCKDYLDARHKSRLALGGEGIALLAGRDAAALAAPEAEDGPVSCIEDDDLDAAGVSQAELEQMITGPESSEASQRLRQWLDSLTVSLRTIFVLRAIAGLSSGEVAGLLAENGGSQARDWTPDGVRSGFRQALCSLASQLIHATISK